MVNTVDSHMLDGGTLGHAGRRLLVGIGDRALDQDWLRIACLLRFFGVFRSQDLTRTAIAFGMVCKLRFFSISDVDLTC